MAEAWCSAPTCGVIVDSKDVRSRTLEQPTLSGPSDLFQPYVTQMYGCLTQRSPLHILSQFTSMRTPVPSATHDKARCYHRCEVTLGRLLSHTTQKASPNRPIQPRKRPYHPPSLPTPPIGFDFKLKSAHKPRRTRPSDSRTPVRTCSRNIELLSLRGDPPPTKAQITAPGPLVCGLWFHVHTVGRRPARAAAGPML